MKKNNMKPTEKSESEVIRELVVLLKLQDSARKILEPDALRFFIVNESQRGINYDQAFLWEKNFMGKLKLTAATGVSRPETESPYFQQFQKLVTHIAATEEGKELIPLSKKNFPDSLHDDWKEMNHRHPIWCPFKNRNGDVTGGIWFNRGHAWQRQEFSLLAFISDAYGHALESLELSRQRLFGKTWKILKGVKIIRTLVLLSLLSVLLVPVRQSVIAPAEVSPINPYIVAPPIDGVVKTIYVEPNQPVQKGQLLFELENQIIRNEYKVALKTLEVARADYLTAVNKSFADPESQAKIPLLKALVKQKEIEVAYAKDLLERIKVRSPESGVVVFSDPNDWLGKPVSVGERIMSLANPDETELQIWLPVSDAILLEKGAEIKTFLNIDPTAPLDARLRQTSYEAQLSPEDVLSFKLKARFKGNQKAARIGLKAVAKIYGEEVTLFYYLFRKPLAALRQYTGL